MKIKKGIFRIVTFLAAIGLVGILLVLFLKSGETRIQYWTTSKDINPGGWLLLTPPKSAQDITLIYDIDTNEIWEIFRTDEADIKSIAADCEEVSLTGLSLPRQPKKYLFLTIPEWPNYLTINSTAKIIDGLKMLRCTQAPPYPAWQGPNYYFVAIDVANSKVLAWNNDGG